METERADELSDFESPEPEDNGFYLEHKKEKDGLSFKHQDEPEEFNQKFFIHRSLTSLIIDRVT